MMGSVAIAVESPPAHEAETSDTDEQHVHRIDLLNLSEGDAKKALSDFHGLVYQFAKMLHPRKHVLYWIDFEDLVAAGEIAVLEAVASFDPTRNVRQVTWVGHIVKRRMLEIVRRARGLSRTEQHTATRLHFIEKDKLDKHGNPYQVPTPEKVAGLEHSRRVEGVSLTMRFTDADGQDRTLDRLDGLDAAKQESLEDSLTRKQRLDWLKTAMRRLLTHGERQAVLAYWRDIPSLETAQAMGISRQRLAQLRENGVKKLVIGARKLGWSDYPQLKIVFDADEE